jgi:hypothetical protein
MKKIISIEELTYYNDKLWSVINHKIEESKDNIISIIPSIEYCTNEDILRLFDPSIPDTPVDPEVPVESVGSITEDNSIVIDETQLENGTYTLRYIDSDENVIGNFNEITSFEINK